jgi:hypothetical protein
MYSASTNIPRHLRDFFCHLFFGRGQIPFITWRYWDLSWAALKCGNTDDQAVAFFILFTESAPYFRIFFFFFGLVDVMQIQWGLTLALSLS